MLIIAPLPVTGLFTSILWYYWRQPTLQVHYPQLPSAGTTCYHIRNHGISQTINYLAIPSLYSLHGVPFARLYASAPNK